MPIPSYQTAADEILRINSLPDVSSLTSAQDVFKFTSVPPASDLVAAYRSLGLLIHPDKNQGNKEEATRAFQKLSQAYNRLKTPDLEVADTILATDIFDLFQPENPYMKGPTIRKMRDIMLSFAGHFTESVQVSNNEPRKIRNFFDQLSIPEVDRILLQAWAEKLFPDRFVDSEAISESYSASELDSVIETLKILGRRHFELQKASLDCFYAELDEIFQAFSMICPTLPTSALPRTPIDDFTAFVRLSLMPANLGLSTQPLASDEILRILNQYATKRGELLHKVLAVINHLYAQPDINEPFNYTQTSLEPDQIVAQIIQDRLIAPLSLSRKEVLDAQILHLFASIFEEKTIVMGAHVVAPKSIPQQSHRYTVHHEGEGINRSWYLTDHFTGQKLPAPRFIGGASDKKQVPIEMVVPGQQQGLPLVVAFQKSGQLGLSFLNLYYGQRDLDIVRHRLPRPTTGQRIRRTWSLYEGKDLVEKHYAYATTKPQNTKGRGYHFYPAKLDGYHEMGDALKTRLLLTYTRRLLDALRKGEDVERLYQQIQTEHTYKNGLIKGQGCFTRFFNQKTDAEKAFEAIKRELTSPSSKFVP